MKTLKFMLTLIWTWWLILIIMNPNGISSITIFGVEFYDESSRSFSDGDDGKSVDDVWLGSIASAPRELQVILSHPLSFCLLLGFLPEMSVYFNALLAHIELHMVVILTKSRLDTKWNFSKYWTQLASVIYRLRLMWSIRLGITGLTANYLGLYLILILRQKWKVLS